LNQLRRAIEPVQTCFHLVNPCYWWISTSALMSLLFYVDFTRFHAAVCCVGGHPSYARGGGWIALLLMQYVALRHCTWC